MESGKRTVPRRPPKRRCPRCGGDHYAWQETALCASCKRETRPDAETLGGMLRQARLERGVEGPNMPEGWEERVVDDIPY